VTRVAGSVRVVPATSVVHLDFNAGEDARIEVDLADDAGQPVEITDVYGCVRVRGALVPVYEWSQANSNTTFTAGQVVLVVARADTALWWAAWGDAEWQLEVTDVRGHRSRVCEGDVRVRSTRRT
jgi:hypothetical protein